MNKIIVVDVCYECPFFHEDGEISLITCKAEKDEKGYPKEIEKPGSWPQWCPLFRSPIEVHPIQVDLKA